MPELDGYEATRKIRLSKTLTNPNVPIIALTSGAGDSERNKCLEVGMNDYVSKPFKILELVEKIESLLPISMVGLLIPLSRDFVSILTA